MTTCSDRSPSDDVAGVELAGLEVQIWQRSALDGVRVVQIDTLLAHGRLRVNLNDAPIWDGDPETDAVPGAHYSNVWEDQHVSEEVAIEVLRFFESPGSAGNFESRLIHAILGADDENIEKLGIGFPEHVRAVGLWRSNKNELRRLAGR